VFAALNGPDHDAVPVTVKVAIDTEALNVLVPLTVKLLEKVQGPLAKAVPLTVRAPLIVLVPLIVNGPDIVDVPLIVNGP